MYSVEPLDYARATTPNRRPVLASFFLLFSISLGVFGAIMVWLAVCLFLSPFSDRFYCPFAAGTGLTVFGLMAYCIRVTRRLFAGHEFPFSSQIFKTVPLPTHAE
jgi:hypothetical protein